nr:Arm DNA-binding domain-containing protein [Ligilactobacillus hohenheimensis]
MAIITKRGNKWQAKIYYYDLDHVRHAKSKLGFKTKKEATIWATEKENELNLGNSIVNFDTLFAEYFWNWFEQFKEANVSERTKLTYRQAYNALHKYLRVPISRINRQKYRQFLNTYGHQHAKSTVSKYNSLYHACIKEALYNGDVKRDFIENVDLAFNKDKTRSIEYLNIDDMQKLCDYLIQTRNRHFTGKYMILTALLTGARLGEIQALTWNDINFQFKTIEINKA